MSPSLVIADDHELLREALAHHAESRAGMRVLAAVANAQEALRACRRFQPDLLLLDIEMPGRDALAIIPDILSSSPSTRIVILTAECRDISIELAIQNGVSGFLLKTDPSQHIFAALARILQGTKVFSSPVLARLASGIESKLVSSAAHTRLASLTPRELEVLRSIARGQDNAQMARSMSISKRTVERHVARLMDAIAIRDRAAIMKYAIDQGLAA